MRVVPGISLAGVTLLAGALAVGCMPGQPPGGGSGDAGTPSTCADATPTFRVPGCEPAAVPCTSSADCSAGHVCNASGLCALPTCGNGVVDPGEECDDQNTDETDACTSDCRLTDPPDGAPISAPDNTWTWVPIDGAVCRDGSQTGFAVNFNSASDKVMLFMEGGGACFDDASCSINPAFYMPGQYPSTGIFDRTNPANPVKDWNYIYIPYCSGDVFTGDADTMVAGAMQHFHGYNNVHLFMKRIVPTFPNPSQVLLTGQSAGGFGAAANYEQIQRDYYNVRVTVFDDSGPPMGTDQVAPCLQQEWRQAWGLDHTTLADCGPDCPNPNDSLLDMTGHVIKRYPDGRAALFSNSADPVISYFYGFGLNQCNSNLASLSPDVFDQGLLGFRSFVDARTDNFGTYYVPGGTSHTCLGGGCFYTMAVDGVALTDYLSALLQGNVSNVGN